MTLGGLYVEGFLRVEGLIFGILRYVATDIKMPRSKFLAKMVSAKFAYQNTGPVCHILLLSIYSGAPARAKRARSGASWVRKFGKLSIRENLVMT